MPSHLDPNKSLELRVLEEMSRARDVSVEGQRRLEEVRADLLRKRVEKETEKKIVCRKSPITNIPSVNRSVIV